MEEERSDLLREFYSITENQKKLLIFLASHPGEGIYTRSAASQMRMASTSVPKALYVLLENDLVEEYTKSKYCVINPVYKSILVD